MLDLNEKVIVAMDVETEEKALALAQTLAGSGCWLKVGLELYAAAGRGIVHGFKELGFPIFLDLKLHDIPTTVERAVRSLVGIGADMLDVHCAGGYEMMALAAEAAHSAGQGAGNVPKVLGVTVLTSMDEQGLAELGVIRPVAEQVVSLALLAKQAGLDGVVASAREAAMLRQACGDDFLIITPGIRPAWSETNDQVRVVTPQQALASGSTYLVVGRPVTRAVDPRQALERLWE